MKQWLSSVMAVLFIPCTSCVHNQSLKREFATYRSWRTQSKWRRLMETVETNASESSARVGLKSETLLPLCEWHLKSVGVAKADRNGGQENVIFSESERRTDSRETLFHSHAEFEDVACKASAGTLLATRRQPEQS